MVLVLPQITGAKNIECATILKFGQLTYWDLDVQLNLMADSGDLWRDQLYEFITQVINQPAISRQPAGGYVCCVLLPSAPRGAAGLVLLNSAGPFSEKTSLLRT